MRTLLVLTLLAQAAPVTFDAVSIKVNTSGERGTSMRVLPGGHVEARNRTLKLLIQNAFGLQDFQIVGGPEWMETARFDISATANADIAPPQVRVMMRALLADRFKLSTHTETRQAPIYALRMARPDGRLGDGLKPAGADGRGGFRNTGASLRSERVSIADFAREITAYAGRPVIDETGLKGDFSLTINWAEDPAGGGDANAASLFTAIREQLGLKLDATRSPIEVLVVDRAEKPAAD